MTDKSNSKEECWIFLGKEPLTQLQLTVNTLCEQKINRDSYKISDIEYLTDLKPLIFRDIDLSLEEIKDKNTLLLRRIIKSWSYELPNPQEITSHRRVIGPIIIISKKLLLRILKPFLVRFHKQQRDFQSAVIEYLINDSLK
jgi:hypothetical protein